MRFGLLLIWAKRMSTLVTTEKHQQSRVAALGGYNDVLWLFMIIGQLWLTKSEKIGEGGCENARRLQSIRKRRRAATALPASLRRA
jgi:hypothetical protein